MAQDGQDAPADIAPTRLQVVLLAYDDDGERDAAKDRYAVIRFPNSYEDAMKAIERNLGECLPSGKADRVDILCRMLNSQGEWIWAKADRADWNIVRAELALTAKPLGIRNRLQSYLNAVIRPPFVKGRMIVAYGEMGGGIMTWTSMDNSSGIIPDTKQDARDFIVAAVNDKPQDWPLGCRVKARRPLSQLEFRFCHFVSDQSQGPNTDLWVDVPTSAYTDDEIWSTTVPESDEILGFTIDLSRDAD
ncbi:hypothetical protein BJ912DRAFT_935575 [Pholiota molesta]|nr:hypothetical protein BJ912DRAFT_935575 [Pholiota molesta]